MSIFQYEINPIKISWTKKVQKWTDTNVGPENYLITLDPVTGFRVIKFKNLKDCLHWRFKWF